MQFKKFMMREEIINNLKNFGISSDDVNPVVPKTVLTMDGKEMNLGIFPTIKVIKDHGDWLVIEIGNPKVKSRDINNKEAEDATGVSNKFAGQRFHIKKSEYSKLFAIPSKDPNAVGGLI